MKTLLKLVIILITTFTFLSCNDSTTTEMDKFYIIKYKGYILKKIDISTYKSYDIIIIKNDTNILKLEVPNWFKEIYNINDTIK